MDSYSVGEVAALAHVSVRTLHHYDDIGLLSPSGRTAAGHRRYSQDDLRRLRDVLFYRELDFGLDEIASMISDPGDTTDDHLRNQHRMLRERIDRHQHLLAALEKQMEARQMGISLTPEDEFEIFGTTRHSTEYAAEAEQRWGDTDAWKESQRRTAAYTKQDWVEIKTEQDEIAAAFVDAFSRGVPADSTEAMAIAERARRQISDRFYECSPEFHRCLGDMYVSDPRFRETIENGNPGLAEYTRDAIHANADAQG